MKGRRVRTLLMLCLLATTAFAAGGCTTDEFLRVGGQTLYNSGKYLCRQSPGSCDADGEYHPGATSNRR